MPRMSSAQFFPLVTSYKTVVQYHSQKVDTDAVCSSYSHFPSFAHTLFCIYLVLYCFITQVGSPTHHHTQDAGYFRYDKDPRYFPLPFQ